MSDDNSANRISCLINQISAKYPDLRYCQIIGNCLPPRDNYYTEDDVLERELVKFCDEHHVSYPQSIYFLHHGDE